MKLKKSRILTTAFLSVSALALLGSVTGTVAWYQYSTRVSAAYVGTTVKSTENLQISVDNGTTWGSEITPTDIKNGSGAEFGSALSPVTTGAQAKDEALVSNTGNDLTEYGPTKLYGNPTKASMSQTYVPYTQWSLAGKDAYMQFVLQFRLSDVDGNDYTRFDDDKALYMTDLTIQDADTSLDLSDAVRVQFHTEYGSNTGNFLFAKDGAGSSLDTYGALDLDGDGEDDKAGYVFSSSDTRETVVYGATDADDKPVQTFYTQTNNPEFFADATKAKLNPTYTDGSETKACSPLGYIPGKTSSADDGILKMTVTIWIEGWEILTDPAVNDNQVWDGSTYLNQTFNVGMSFGVTDYGEN